MGEDVDIGGEVWSSLWQLSLLDNKCLYCASASVGDYSQVHPTLKKVGEPDCLDHHSMNKIMMTSSFARAGYTLFMYMIQYMQSLCIVCNEIYTILMYTYLNPKCGDVSLEYWGCAKTHFLEHIDKSKRFDKKGETFQFFFYQIQENLLFCNK